MTLKSRMLFTDDAMSLLSIMRPSPIWRHLMTPDCASTVFRSPRKWTVSQSPRIDQPV